MRKDTWRASSASRWTAPGHTRSSAAATVWVLATRHPSAQAGDELVCDAPHVARADREHEVARPELRSERGGHAGRIPDEPHGAPPADRARHDARIDPRDRRLVRGVDVGHHDLVGAVER